MNVRLGSLALLIGFSTLAFADPKATFKLQLPPKVTVGKSFTATLVVTFPNGWHGYQNPPTNKFLNAVTVRSAQGAKFGKASYPKGVMKTVAGEKIAIYEGVVKIPVTLTVSKPGAQNIKLDVLYQQCNDSTCMPPAIKSVSASVKASKA
ncbi:MAG: protein-disulfide reductase DsbD N-terminal domain-containing protein [Fimbriimonadaceae bacterium]